MASARKDFGCTREGWTLPFWTNTLHKRIGKDLSVLSLDDIEKRRQHNFPSVIIVDGHSGQGKSTFAVEICDYLNGRPIVFSEALFMGYKQFTLGLDTAKDLGYKAVIYDEAGDFDKSSYMSQVNKLINRVFDTFRSTNIIVIMVLPSFFRLPDSLYEKGLARVLYHIHDRARVGRFTGYDMNTQVTMRDWSKKKGIGYRIKVYNIVESCLTGKFLDLPPERSKALSDYCNKHKKGERRDVALNLSNLKDLNALAVQFGCSYVTMRTVVGMSQVPPTNTYKRKMYFDENAVNKIKIYYKVRKHNKQRKT
jgi:adenylate kinase family enzyme